MDIIKELTDQVSASNLWLETKTIERNDYLMVPGNIENALYYILEGSVRIFMIEENEEHTIRFGYKKSLVTSLDSFLNDQKTVFYIQAIKKTHYRSISKKAFFNLIEKNEANRNLWIKLLESFVIQQMERETDLLTNAPEERYLRVLKRSPQLFQEIPHKYIASYLRMSPETLSRLKKS